MRDTPHRTITELEDRLQRANEVIASASPLYTVDEVKQLAFKWLDEQENGEKAMILLRLDMSRFFAWLARREREGQSSAP